MITVPAGHADTLRTALGVLSFSGLIHSTTLVNGVPQVSYLTIPSTPAGVAGTAGAQDVALNLVTGTGTSPFDVQEGQVQRDGDVRRLGPAQGVARHLALHHPLTG